MRIVALTMLGLLLCLQNFCQHLYSLDNCFAAAKENNIGLKKSRNNIESSSIDKKAATFNLFPAVYGSAEHVFSSGKNIDPVTNNFVRDNFSGGEFDVTLQLNIFSGFNALNAIKSSSYRIKAGEYAYQQNELETFSAITVAYVKLMYAREQVATIKNKNLHSQNELDVVQQSIAIGKLSKSDYYTINMRFKSEQAELAQAQNDSMAAINELKHVVGFEVDRLFDVRDIDSNEIGNIVRKEYNIAEVLNKLLKEHPALQKSMYAEKSAEMNLKSAKGNMIPNVSLTGNVFSNYNLTNRNVSGDKIAFGRQLGNNFGKTVGVLVEIPLFNHYQNRFAVEKEKINLSNAKLETQQVENDLTKNTQQLLNDFQSAQKEYVLQTEAFIQGELAYEAFEERHKLGYISSLDLVIAKDQFYAQQVKTTQAKYNLYFKYKLIELTISSKIGNLL